MKNIDQTNAYQSLQQLQPFNLKNQLTAERMNEYVIHNDTLSLSYGTTLVSDKILDQLQQLADEQGVIQEYNRILSGDIMNPGEGRKVLHHQTRSASDRGFYGKQQARINAFASQIHQGQLTGYTGKPFKTVVQIGIGGSDLGPRAMYLALERIAKKQYLTAKFIANVDPDDANLVLKNLDFETTLIIVVSKSGTTQETLTNLEFIKQTAIKAGVKEKSLVKHMIAVTGKNSPMDDPAKYLASFYIDEHIGGRYSSTSAVGGAVITLAFGSDVFESFLNGAGQMDAAAKNPSIKENISLMSALIGVWERNIMGFSSKAIIPYSEALTRFPAHLQQLDCESNGKSVNRNGEPISYQTGPVIFGEPGTNGQHSFFQKLHQGSDIVPIQFIGFSHPQINADLNLFGSSSQEKLIANLVAQMIALAKGQDDKNPNKTFSGNRPTSLLYAKKLTPEVLGALLACYENIVMFQGLLWHLNSFDQEGVQLGKLLTKQVLTNIDHADPALKSLLQLI